MPNHPAQNPHCTYWTDGDADTPVFQHPAEMEWMLSLYQARKPKRVLEVGTYYGGTLKQWLLRGVKGVTVVSVDTYTAADNRARYAEWAAPKKATVHVIVGNSHDPATVAAAAEHGPYDWIILDADHRDAAIRADYAAYRDLAAPGGVIVFHDIIENTEAHPEIEVFRLWRELKATERTEEFVEGNGLWGGIGVVYVPEDEGDGITAEEHAADGLAYNYEHG